MWRKAMVYLGLGDDAAYAEDDGDQGGSAGSDGGRDRAQPPPSRQPPSSSVSTVSTANATSSVVDEPTGLGAVRRIGSGGGDGPDAAGPSGLGTPRPRPKVVRPIAPEANPKPHLVTPASFNEAQEVADKFKSGQAVVVNLVESDRELSRRLVDFASGLCYGLGGQMERLDDQVYLLSPSGVDISPEERRRLQERGYEA